VWQAPVHRFVKATFEPKVTWNVDVEAQHLDLPLWKFFAVQHVQALAVVALGLVIMATLADWHVQESSVAILKERDPFDHAVL
jgi:hypothetical protein